MCICKLFIQFYLQWLHYKYSVIAVIQQKHKFGTYPMRTKYSVCKWLPIPPPRDSVYLRGVCDTTLVNVRTTIQINTLPHSSRCGCNRRRSRSNDKLLKWWFPANRIVIGNRSVGKSPATTTESETPHLFLPWRVINHVHLSLVRKSPKIRLARVRELRVSY